MSQYSTIHRRQSAASSPITPATGILAIDMAKYRPMALLCDYQGQIMEPPFVFGPHATGLADIRQRVTAHQAQQGRDHIVVGIEPTGRYHEPLVRELRVWGWTVRIISPNATALERRADQRRSKTDPIDLMAIARCVLNQRGSEWALVDGIPAAIRAISRARRTVVRQATQCKNIIRSILDQTLLEYQGFAADPTQKPVPILNPWTQAGREWLETFPCPEDFADKTRTDLTVFNEGRALGFSEDTLDRIWMAAQRALPLPTATAEVWRTQVLRMYTLLGQCEALIARYDADLEALVVQTDALLWLTTPRIAVVCAADLYGELGSIERFPSAKTAIKLAGTDPTVHDSGEHHGRYGAASREGNRHLRAAVTQVGDSLIANPRPNPYFVAFAERLKARGLTAAQVRVAVGNKFLHVGMAMLQQRQVFAPPTWDGPPLAQDWRKKLHYVRNRARGEETWSRLMRDRRAH